MNKKGIATELLTILIVVFLMIISIMFTYQFVNQFASTQTVTNSGLNINITQQGLTAIRSFDSLMVFIIIALTVWTIIGAFYIQTNPVFFVIGVIGLIPVLILAGYFSNLYNAFIDTGQFSAFTTGFVSIPFIMARLPMFMLIIGILIIISLYAKDRINSGGGQI